ncbi:MAG TPA: hypothetical protein VFZ53_18330 [Polyangiaceae bacterium]
MKLRLLAALALALLGGDHVLPALHHLVVSHELCAEHGVLEHAGAAAREHAHRDDTPAFQGISAEGEHHDHCGSVPASPPRAPFVAAFSAAFAPVCAAAPPFVAASAAVPPADVLAFAPKQSPPA